MMERIGKAALCLALSLLLLAAPCFAVSASDFSDVAGHWAQETLARAVSDGLLSGFEDGTMRPDAVITQAEILQILCRALAMEPASAPAALGLGGGEWYAKAALAAYDRGLIADAARLSAPMDRGSAMILLCRALGLRDDAPDPAALEGFREEAAAPEVLSLVERGVVEGADGSLMLEKSVSRAEFVTMLYRALGTADAVAHGRTELREISGGGTLWCGADCAELLLHDVHARELIICAAAPEKITIEFGSELERVRLLGGGSPRLLITGDSRVKELAVEGENCSLQLIGSVDTLVIRGGGFRLDNWYGVGTAVLRTTRSLIPEEVWWYKDERDYGITNTTFLVSAKERIAVGEVMRASAVLTIPDKALGKTVSARWLLGEVLLREETVLLAESGQRLSYSGVLEFSPELSTLAPVRLELRYSGVDGEQLLAEESAPVEIDNRGEEYYRKLEEERVLALVGTGYDGDYTVEWAQQHDYSAEDKTIWVNAKGFESETEYLIWVSVKYQRCNIFRGSRGAWTLVRSGIVGTGAAWSPTPEGVWKTTYLNELGWYAETYTVRPVVGFKGGGYAFHSRLYKPGTNILTEPNLGYPMSHGCVRMFDEDVWWIFNNVPVGTTVVVY